MRQTGELEQIKAGAIAKLIAATPALANPASAVAHPLYYNIGKIEVIAAIDDWRLGFNLGNAVKYIARAGKKDPSKTLEDLQKAAWHLDHEIKRLRETP